MEQSEQFNLRLTAEEKEQLHILAKANYQSGNSFLRSLLRQAWNKSTVEVPTKKTPKHAEVV